MVKGGESMALEEYDGTQELKGLVTFSAPWCGYCKFVAPKLEAQEEEILKVNIEQYEDIAKKYEVMSIPALLEIDGDEVKQRYTGFNEISNHLE